MLLKIKISEAASVAHTLLLYWKNRALTVSGSLGKFILTAAEGGAMGQTPPLTLSLLHSDSDMGLWSGLNQIKASPTIIPNLVVSISGHPFGYTLWNFPKLQILLLSSPIF